MQTKCLVYRIALTTTSLVAILTSSLTFPSAKVEARPCGSDDLSKIGCFLDPFNPLENNGSGQSSDYTSYYHIYIQNKTNRPIWVAVHFRKDGYKRVGTQYEYDQWRTEGYWKLNPGQKTLILDDEERISNRIIYFHAHDEQGKVWGSSEKVFDIRGENQPFFEANMGDEIGKYTQSFTAN